MRKRVPMILLAIILLISGISLCRISRGCQVDEFYLTRGESLSSTSPERLQEASIYEKTANKDKLDKLLQSKLVIRLKDNVKVQALERSIPRKMIKIKFEDSQNEYWVNDGSLKQLKCNEK